MRHHLRHLGVEALAHLGAAVVDQDGPVGIHMHQRPRLVEMRHVERDAKLDGGQRQATFEHSAAGVVGAYCRPACRVTCLLGQLGHQWADDVVVKHLAVRCHVVAGGAVKVGLPHRQRVQAQLARHAVQDHLDGQRALRPTKTTERGVALGVGAGAIAVHGHVGQPVGVVKVAQGPGHHRRAQVSRVAGVGDQIHRHTQDAARTVVAHVPADLKAVAAAGDQHVVIPVWPQFDRPLQLGRRQRGDAGKQRALAFFATKTAPHAPADHLHPVGRQAQGMRHQMLHLAGVLGAAIHQQATVFLRLGVADLAFQIKLFLPTQREAALPAVRCAGQRGGGITARQVHGRHHVVLQRVGLQRGQHGGQGADLQRLFGQCSGAAGGVAAGGNHRKHRLAHVPHRALGQDGVVMHDGAAIIRPGDVGRREHRHHPGLGPQQGQVNALQRAVGHRAQAQRGVQGAGQLGQVVDVGRGPGHMQVGGFVRVGTQRGHSAAPPASRRLGHSETMSLIACPPRD